MSIAKKFRKIVSDAHQKSGMGVLAFEKKLGLKPSSIKAVINNQLQQTPSIDKAEKIAKALGLEFYIGPKRNQAIEFEESEDVIPHFGQVGAGGDDLPNDGRVFEAFDKSEEKVKAPIGLKPEHMSKWGGLLALTVRGRSMEPMLRDGDILYMYGDDPASSTPERLIGQDCAVILAGERADEAYVKRIRRADNGKQGYYNLESLNPNWPTMVDVQLMQARPVRFIHRKI